MPVRSPAEFERLHRLIVEYEGALPPDLQHGPKPSLDEVRSRYSEGGAGFVARESDADAGCVVVTPLDSGTAVLQRLYVVPAYRGRGTARQLAQSAVDYARERGFARIVLDTDRVQLQAAYALYRSLGFTECEPYAPVHYARATFMELRLDDSGATTG